MKYLYYTLLASVLVVNSTTALANGATPHKTKKPTLSDLVVGTYQGDVISDSKGSSKNNVTLTVAKKGPSTVLVTSNYGRLGAVMVNLEAMSNRMILSTGGRSTFVYDPTKRPIKLDYSPDGTVSYSGYKR